MKVDHHYTSEKNHQLLLSLLKAHGIRKVIASPGTTNISLVGSMQSDPWFEIYSSVDERSAAYMACGMAAESGEPVVISCTGATASRNYMPGLTEAFYRKLPVLAITSHQGNERVGHLIAQNIDRTHAPNDIVGLSVTLPTCKDSSDEWNCEIQINKALLELRRHGGIPVHINLITTYSKDFTTRELPNARFIQRYCPGDVLPDIPDGSVAIFVGSHREMTTKETEAIDNFCATYDAVVYCDHTSGYYGRYRVNLSLVASQNKYRSRSLQVDTLIHIGEVSGDYYILRLKPKRVWRVSEDGALRDTFKKLVCVFETRIEDFFSAYAEEDVHHDAQLRLRREEYQRVYELIPELPLSNLWLAYNYSTKIPENAVIHLGILNTLRSWNMFDFPLNVRSWSNVGGFGIDGNMSTLIGAALASPDKLFFGIVGDLSFFYDMNSLGNRHLPPNVRIMLINNGRGQEFCNYDNTGTRLGDDVISFIAAGNHYGNKSPQLVRHYAESLGFIYLSASDKCAAQEAATHFFKKDLSPAPILFEVFTDGDEENQALQLIRSVAHDENMKEFTLEREDTISKIRRFIRKQKRRIRNIFKSK